MSNDAAQASAGATYRMLRELGSRSQHSYAAIREPNELVVVQRFVRANARDVQHARGEFDGATPLDAEAMALLLRDARCLAKNWHPNIARVRHVDLASKPRSVLTIASELVDGATLEELIEAAQPARTSPRDPLLALPVLVRILLDVLVGLHALHGLRDGMNAPLGAIHGELCPANVVVGKDGVARIVNVLRRRPVRVGDGSEAVAYAAPEALDADGTDDPRCDLYAVGVMLWEGLAGKRLYEERDAALILARQREGELARPSIDPTSPFARLADVALRALSFDPALRYRGVTEMAADLRKIAGTKLATGASVAAHVADLAGDRIRMRRAVLEPATSGTRRRASERSIVAAEESIDTAKQSVPTPEAPVARQLTRRISPHRASMQKVAPTLEREIPVALIAASRPTAEIPEDANAVDIDAVDVDAADVRTVDANAGDEVQAAGPPSTEHLIAAALAKATTQMRAVALERLQSGRAPSSPALPPTETPGDFVIPIDVTETWNESAPRQRRRFASVAIIAALALVAMGGFLAMRSRTSATDASFTSGTSGTSRTSAATAPLPASPMPSNASPPDPNAIETASALASASASASASAAAIAASGSPSSASARPAPRMVAPSGPPPAAKPKKSIYEPDSP